MNPNQHLAVFPLPSLMTRSIQKLLFPKPWPKTTTQTGAPSSSSSQKSPTHESSLSNFPALNPSPTSCIFPHRRMVPCNVQHVPWFNWGNEFASWSMADSPWYGLYKLPKSGFGRHQLMTYTINNIFISKQDFGAPCNLALMPNRLSWTVYMLAMLESCIILALLQFKQRRSNANHCKILSQVQKIVWFLFRTCARTHSQARSKMHENWDVE